jgi:hypothetical protein
MSRSRIFHLYEDVTIADEGLQNLDLWSMLKAFLYRATPTVTQDLSFSGLIRKTAHSVASYDTHRDAEDLL